MTSTKRTIRSDIPGGDSITPAQQQCTTLYIGKDICMTASKVKSCEHLTIAGELKTSLKGVKRVEVLNTGTLRGKIETVDAMIEGVFEGDLKASGKLTICRSAVIHGNLYYNSLNVEPGASIEGNMAQISTTTHPENLDPIPVKISTPDQDNKSFMSEALGAMVFENENSGFQKQVVE
jgi:cytoskeletal protein CcmA (bactofilin family)